MIGSIATMAFAAASGRGLMLATPTFMGGEFGEFGGPIEGVCDACPNS